MIWGHNVFSAPEPKAHVHYCDHALSVVRRPSVRRPSLTFHKSETVERNSTKLDRKQDLNILYQVCVFRADRKNKMAALASDWLRHFRLLLWNGWTEFNKTWQEARSQRPLPSLCFSGRSEKQDRGPGLWLAETFSTSPLKRLNRIQRKLDRKQDLKVLYQVCVFRADRKKQDGRPGLWLAETFSTSPKRLNGIQRNLTGSKISTSSTKFVFFWADRKKQDGSPGLWLAETFSTSPLKRLNGIQRNLTGSKISTSSTKFVFFRADRKKQDGRPGLWLAETFSSSTLKPLNGIQWNLTGSKISMSSTKFVFFGRISKTKMSALADFSKRWHIVLRCTICGPLGLLLFSVVSFNIHFIFVP